MTARRCGSTASREIESNHSRHVAARTRPFLSALNRTTTKNRHENIVRSYGSSIKGKQMYIFLEYMPGGSVRLLLDRFGAFEEKITLLYAKQMLRGLSFLHANGVAHRDIKVCVCLEHQVGSWRQKKPVWFETKAGLVRARESGLVRNKAAGSVRNQKLV